MGKYSDFRIYGEEGVPLYILTDEPGLVGFYTRMGERSYLNREQVAEVQRFLKKWLKNNPEPDIAEPEPSLQGDADAEYTLVLSPAVAKDAECILGMLKKHKALAEIQEDKIEAVARHIASEDDCSQALAGYLLSWEIIPESKVTTVKKYY